VSELAVFGGTRLFATPKSTSNLVKPDFETFLNYSKRFFEQHQYTNNGPNVRFLEQRLADFHQTEFCVTFCSGFWALVLAIDALALKGRTEIVMPSLTYRRMADIAAWTSLKPHFCEVETETLAPSAATVSLCVNENTALILGVHPIVNCCDIEGLTQLAKEKNIPLLFDSVESVYETTRAGKVGKFGDAEVFSLHASKLLNGFEGGYLATNNAGLARRLSLTRSFGFESQDRVTLPGGTNAKLNEVHAAMALAGLDALGEQIPRNRQRYYAYKDLLGSVPGVRLLEFDERYQTSYKNIVIELLEDWPLTRADTLDILNAENILARAYYSPPLHRRHMAYPHVPGDLPLTDRVAERFMLLPSGYFIGDADIRDIVGLLSFLSTNAKSVMDRMHTNRSKLNESR
jgi:dTDP-4-amino-4,6-dideoxygalactose transaminase